MSRQAKTVLHLLSNRWNSAITEYALSAARALEMQGWKTIFSPLAGSPAEIRARKMNLFVRPLNDFTLLRVSDFNALLKETNPDLIITYGGPENSLAWMARVRSRKIHVVRFRGCDFPVRNSSIGNFLAKKRHSMAHKHCDLILTPSRKISTILQPISPCPVETAILGIDSEKFYRQDDDAPRTKDILILGRFDPVKGHREFFKFFAEFLKNWDVSEWRPRLRVIGEPKNISISQMHQFATECGLRPGLDIELTTDHLDNIGSVMNGALAGIIPSIGSEIICRVAEEFLLCGTPIAVSGAGSLSEVLCDPDFGFTWEKLLEDSTGVRMARFLKVAASETTAKRDQRAKRAHQVFSYEAMGTRLQTILGSIP